MIKNLIIIVLLALLLAIAIDNQHLGARNRRLTKAIREVVYTNAHHIPGYIEPEKVVKDIYISHLTK